MSIKPTKLVMALCDEMYQRRADTGKDYPGAWRTKTREKMQDQGMIESKGGQAGFYFTESGLDWYLQQRPELDRNDLRYDRSAGKSEIQK